MNAFSVLMFWTFYVFIPMPMVWHDMVRLGDILFDRRRVAYFLCFIYTAVALLTFTEYYQTVGVIEAAPDVRLVLHFFRFSVFTNGFVVISFCDLMSKKMVAVVSVGGLLSLIACACLYDMRMLYDHTQQIDLPVLIGCTIVLSGVFYGGCYLAQTHKFRTTAVFIYLVVYLHELVATTCYFRVVCIDNPWHPWTAMVFHANSLFLAVYLIARKKSSVSEKFVSDSDAEKEE